VAEELLLGRVPPSLSLNPLRRIGLAVLKPFDELVGLVAGEPAPGLTLSKPHWTPRVSKIAMPGALNECKQLLHLPRRRRRTRLLSERHLRYYHPGRTRVQATSDSRTVAYHVGEQMFET
jgi:hypothetical protein